MKSRNRTLYIWSKIFFLSMIIDPIFILYACESGLNATQLFTLSSVQTLTIVLLEIPTGVIADLYGCKTSIILGSLAFILANIIYVTQPGFWGFLIAEILSGLYKVLFSGSDETYLYLELRRCNKENEYAKISGRIDSINFALTGALSILTGYMYLLDRRLPFLVCLIFTTISLFCSFNLENLKENAHGQKSVGQTYSAYLQVIKNGTKSILTQKKLAWFIMYSSALSFLLVAILSTYQLYFLKLYIPPEYFGWIYFFLYIASSLSSQKAYAFKSKNMQKTFMLLLLLLTVTPILMLSNIKLLIMIIIIPRIIIGVYPALIKEYINKEIKESRATIFSIRSLFMRIIQIVLLPLTGCIIDQYNLNISYLFIAGIGILSYVILKRYRPSRPRRHRSG